MRAINTHSPASTVLEAQTGTQATEEGRAQGDEFDALLAGLYVVPALTPQVPQQSVSATESAPATPEETLTVTGIPSWMSFDPSAMRAGETDSIALHADDTGKSLPPTRQGWNQTSLTTPSSSPKESDLLQALRGITDTSGAARQLSLQQTSDLSSFCRTTPDAGKSTGTLLPRLPSLKLEGLEPPAASDVPVDEMLRAADIEVSSNAQSTQESGMSEMNTLLAQINSSLENPLRFAENSPAQAHDPAAPLGGQQASTRTPLGASNIAPTFQVAISEQTSHSIAVKIKSVTSVVDKPDGSTMQEGEGARLPPVEATHGSSLLASQNFSAQAAAVEGSGDSRGEAQKVAAQLVRVIKEMAAEVVVRHEPRSFRIRLRPEELGEVDIRITHDAKGLNAQLTVEKEATRDALAQGLGHLREMLEQAGINIRQLDINLGSQAHTDTGAQSGAYGQEFSRSVAAGSDSSLLPEQALSESEALNQEGRLVSLRA